MSEWTADTVESIAIPSFIECRDGYEAVADAHNAQIAALMNALKEAREVIAEEYGATVAAQSPLIKRIDEALAKVK